MLVCHVKAKFSWAIGSLEYTWGKKKKSLPHYFSLIRFWLRSNSMNHKPLSYGTSSHRTQCLEEEVSLEAATKARSSSDPCWVFGTVGLSASQVDITENVYSGPDRQVFKRRSSYVPLPFNQCNGLTNVLIQYPTWHLLSSNYMPSAITCAC